MLSPEPMRHLSLVVLTGDLEATTRSIARVGVLHLLDVRHSLETLGAIRPYDVVARVAELERLAQRLDTAAGFLGVPAGDGTPETAEDAGDRDLASMASAIEAVEAQIADLRGRTARADEEGERTRQLLHNARALAPIGLPIEHLHDLRYVHLVSGLLPPRNLDRLSESLGRMPHLLVPLGETEGRTLLFALCLQSDGDVLDRTLRAAQFERVELPRALAGDPQEIIHRLEGELASSGAARAEVDEARAELARRLAPELRRLAGLLARERLLAEARSLMGRSERIALVTGWVPAVLAPQLEEAVRLAVADRCVIQWREPAAVDGVKRGRIPVPILLHNPVLVRPFERLVRNYGLPLYGEVEPTLVVALAFLTMFGFMFGDVGHGAVLFAAGYFVYRRMFRYRDYALILMECGVFSVAFGFLYGSVFGVEHWLPALWLRPMDDMARLMRTALIFGAGFLSVGIVLNLSNAVRRRDLKALWGHNGLLGALAYWIAAGLFLRRLTLGPGSVTVGTALVLLAVPAAMILFKGPVLALWAARREPARLSAGDLLATFVESIVELLDTAVSTISNTATFIRLAAFALSHAGLFLATFSVAGAVAQTAAGSFGAALVLLLGNALIIVLEGMIVSIQTIRLEYYEFFSKFYSCGGEEYRPFRLAGAHPHQP